MTEKQRKQHESTKIMPPSIGRIVLFRSEVHGFMAQGGEVPAIIVRVNAHLTREKTTVSLRPFPDLGGELPYVADVPYNDNLNAIPNDRGYWRWPLIINPGAKA